MSWKKRSLLNMLLLTLCLVPLTGCLSQLMPNNHSSLTYEESEGGTRRREDNEGGSPRQIWQTRYHFHSQRCGNMDLQMEPDPNAGSPHQCGPKHG